MTKSNKTWDWEISANSSDWSWDLKVIWEYRYLLFSLVKRNLVFNYQQTILGPFWTLLQPLLTLTVYVLVFGKMVGLSTGTLPPVLFYFSGIILWNFFNDSFIENSNTFRDNIYVFSKVYFPRIVMPLSITITHFFRLLIQLSLLLLLLIFYRIFKDFSIPFNWNILFFPFSVLMIGALGLALGLTCSILTAKYRDISNLVVVGIRLLMFVTPVIYPLAAIKNEFRWVVNLNPLTPFFELFRLSLLGEGLVNMVQLILSSLFIISLVVFSVLLFNRRGSKLIDVV